MTTLNIIPLHERLSLLVQHALPGTLIPVDSIRQLLTEDAESPALAAPGMSLEQVALRCAGLLHGGRPVQLPAVRKWIRSGLRGVKLSAFEWGQTYRVHEEEFEAFVEAVKNAPPRQFHRRTSGSDRTTVGIRNDIAASLSQFREEARKG